MDRIESQSMDAAAWKSTVERMVEKGAQLTLEEQTEVINYLAKTYP
jgi:ribosomal protein L17